jgi:signal transduction histidine kinase/CheY-like chemotaxis protein
VAISAPIINQQGQFAGLVEGSLNLYKFAHFAPASEQEVTHFLVLDRFDQVVYSSESLNLAFLQKLKPRYIEDREFGQVVQLKSSGGGFLFSEEMTRNGWRVMYLISKDYYFYSISEAYRWLFVFTLLIVIVTLGLASFLTRLVERPLSELLKSFYVMGKGEPVIKQTPSRFYEFNLLFDTFYRTYHQLKIAHEKEQEALSKKLAAEKQYEAMTEILSKVSHELRTPLNAILGQAQLLLMESPPDRYHQALTQIETSSRFLVSLIDDLLQLSKIDAGVLTLSSQAVELNSVVNQALQMLELEIGAKDLAVSMDLKATNGSFVAADPNRLLQVIVNLISNAIKYNRPNGKIRIESQADQSWIRLSVADTGFGIEKEHYDKVFQPFQRLGHEHGNIEGSGIGLSLSYRLVELMGGKMDFTSEEDVGSCFFFELKRTSLTEDKSTKEQEHKQSPLNLSQTRVLYIEDNRVNYMIIEAWLQKKGVQQINRASTGREAIEMIKAFTPDLVLCDLGLPDMDGFELFRKLIKINSSLRIIALTADNSASTQAQCRRMGFSGFVAKPVEFGVLQREMARVLSL